MACCRPIYSDKTGTVRCCVSLQAPAWSELERDWLQCKASLHTFSKSKTASRWKHCLREGAKTQLTGKKTLLQGTGHNRSLLERCVLASGRHEQDISIQEMFCEGMGKTTSFSSGSFPELGLIQLQHFASTTACNKATFTPATRVHQLREQYRMCRAQPRTAGCRLGNLSHICCACSQIEPCLVCRPRSVAPRQRACAGS